MEDVVEIMKPIGHSSSKESFHSLVVVEFASSALQDTIDWIVNKIKAPKISGGGGLLVKSIEIEGKAVIHVGARINDLLLAAEIMEIKKLYKDGTMREVQLADLQEFENSDDLDSFLTLAEKQRIVKHELEAIRALEGDRSVPGLPKANLYKGRTLIPYFIKSKVIAQMFPLHDKRELKALSFDWYKSVFSAQPLDRIQKYFGETVAMYFAFLGYYTMALIPPAFIGVISEFMRQSYGSELDSTTIFFCIFNLVWATIFLEAWKRNCSTLAYKWGTIKMEHYEEARPEYYGTLSRNKITGRLEPKYPKWKRVLRFYGVSIPVVSLCLVVTFYVMLVYFWSEDFVLAYHKRHNSTFSSILLYVPTIVYAIVIVIMNTIYRTIAKRLNDWENHRLQSAYDNHLVVKLVLFDFINCFISLFYVAFYMQDLKLLRSNMAALLITQQILGQIIESVIPYAMYKWRKHTIIKKQESPESSPLLSKYSELTEDVKKQAEIEGSRDPYLVKQTELELKTPAKMRGTLDDYLEMYLQFGYVFLFSAVFPTAALWALINNFTEIRTDAFKMCRTFQRPFAQPTAGIGAWQVAFEIMSVLAVVTNCALLALTPQGLKYDSVYGDVNYILFFVIAEHVLLFVKITLSYLIPDEPEWVETALAQTEYKQKLALRAQRVREARQHLREKSADSSDPDIVLISADEPDKKDQ